MIEADATARQLFLRPVRFHAADLNFYDFALDARLDADVSITYEHGWIVRMTLGTRMLPSSDERWSWPPA